MELNPCKKCGTRALLATDCRLAMTANSPSSGWRIVCSGCGAETAWHGDNKATQEAWNAANPLPSGRQIELEATTAQDVAESPHPRYDAKDPKAGQPVLVGEHFYSAGTQYECMGVKWNGEVITGWDKLGSPLLVHGAYYSAPPAPTIEDNATEVVGPVAQILMASFSQPGFELGAVHAQAIEDAIRELVKADQRALKGEK